MRPYTEMFTKFCAFPKTLIFNGNPDIKILRRTSGIRFRFSGVVHPQKNKDLNILIVGERFKRAITQIISPSKHPSRVLAIESELDPLVDTKKASKTWTIGRTLSDRWYIKWAQRFGITTPPEESLPNEVFHSKGDIHKLHKKYREEIQIKAINLLVSLRDPYIDYETLLNHPNFFLTLMTFDMAFNLIQGSENDSKIKKIKVLSGLFHTYQLDWLFRNLENLVSTFQICLLKMGESFKEFPSENPFTRQKIADWMKKNPEIFSVSKPS